MVLGLIKEQVVEHGLDHGRSELLAAEAVTAAVALDVAARFCEGVNNIEVEGLAERAGLLGAVENGDLLAGCGDRCEELVGCERPVKTDLQNAELLALLVEVVDRFFRNVCAAAHDDEDVLGIGCADVIEEVIMAAGQLADLLHVILNDLGDLRIVDVRGFAALEVDIRVLRGTGLMRMLGVQRAVAESLDGVHIEELAHVFILDLLDLLDLVGGAEAVEEMNEGNAGLDRGQMGHESEVHDFLDGSGGEHRETGLAAAHNVAVVAEDRKGMSGESAGGNVENAGKELTGDLVHIGDHQKKTLGSGKGGGQSAGGKGAVNSARSAALGLHLGDADLLTEQVDPALCAPLIGNLCHGRGRSDGVDCCHIGKCIGDMRRSGIAIDSDGLCH